MVVIQEEDVILEPHRSGLLNGSLGKEVRDDGFGNAGDDSDEEMFDNRGLMDNSREDGRTSEGLTDIPMIINEEDMPGGEMMFNMSIDEGYKRPSMAQERRETFSKLKQIDTKLVYGRQSEAVSMPRQGSLSFE